MEPSSQSITITPRTVGPPKAPVRIDPSVARRYRHLIVKLEAELNAAEGRLKRCRDEQQALQADVRKQKADKDARETRLGETAQALKTAQAEIFRLNGEIDNLRQSIDEERKKRDEAESRCAEHLENLAQAKESLDANEKLKNENEELERKLKKANDAITDSNRQYGDQALELKRTKERLESAQKELKELKEKPKDPKPGPGWTDHDTVTVAKWVGLAIILLAAGFLIWQTLSSAKSSLETAQANQKLLERIDARSNGEPGGKVGGDTDTSARLAAQLERLDDIGERLTQIQSSITPIEGDHPVLKQLEEISEDIKRNRKLIAALKNGGSGNGNAAIKSRIDEILKKLNAIQNQLGRLNPQEPGSGDPEPGNGNEPASPVGSTPPPGESSTLVKRTKIYPHSPVPVLSGQVLIKLLGISIDPGSRKMSASFHITLPNMKEVRLTNMSEGIRRAFEYQQRTYFFEVLSLSRAWAEIQVRERI